MRIGLLGGSFNPAHDGHRLISLMALRRLGLDQVWWLVSPQNPLKPVAGMAPFRTRVAGARLVARHPRIKVSDLESRFPSRYTADVLPAIARSHRQHRFVWLMGADNLIQIRHWQRWTEIFEAMPIAVFNRPGYAYRALAGLAAKRFARARLTPSGSTAAARRLVNCRPPAWLFLPEPHCTLSATGLRNGEIMAATATERPSKRARTVAANGANHHVALDEGAGLRHVD
nr:nicotinate-nucleotide adenylyltransferase [Oceanibacterium hippocampi]